MDVILLKRRAFPSPPLKEIREWVTRTVEKLRVEQTAVGILFCGPRTMRRYQRDFRNLDSITDVLSFPGEGEYLGDVVICVDRVRRQAEEEGRSFKEELKMMVVHGLLHCAGYDHSRDRGEMLRLQSALLEELC